ncbi:NAD-binding protein [Sulfurovum sp. CS9]|uniref:NAD-binding protein n=1 Tax=Sulfurovum sp. CS9 TaxID=3391146 RepID=UPI0039E7696B
MHHFILKLSHMIDNSSRYQKTKSFFRSLLEDVNYPYKKYFDYFMIFLIIGSITVLIASKTVDLPRWLIDLDLYFVTTVFALEYLLRLWVSHDIHKYILATSQEENRSIRYMALIKSKLRYMLSLPALIDLIAIFPQFRIIRLFKLYHYMHGTSSLFQALIKKRFEFIFLGYLLFGIVFSFGTLFYALEFGVNKELHSYLDAIYWALVTVSTVGYGDISPVTDLGKIISMFGIVLGIGMLSFVTSVMVSAFSERFDELRNSDSMNHVHKMRNVVIINGYGHLGMTIAKKLRINKKYEPVIIENDETKASLAMSDGYNVIKADGSSAKLIKELYKKNNILAMLTLTSSDIDNIYFILNAKSIYRDCVIFARMNHSYLLPQYVSSGVNEVIEPYSVVDSKALHYVKNHSVEKGKVVVFGYTHKSKQLCKILKNEGELVTIYENSEENHQKAIDDGFNEVFFVDFEQSKYLDEIPLHKEDMVVCAMYNEALNVYHSISLKSHGFEGEIVALSDSKEDNRKFILAGVHKIFDMYEESANLFVEMIENSTKERKS